MSRETWRWIQQAGRPTRGGWPRLLLHRWQSFWFERTLALQRQLPTPAPLQADPLFILGLWRSGTTYLHELVGCCPGMIYPATWQCMGSASFRLQTPPAKGQLLRRPMDDMAIDNLSPQEDEFALLALGVPSVYRGFLDPRRLPELAQWLDPEAWAIDRPDGWLDVWRQFLTGVAADRPGRLVLKSPNHTFRIKATTSAFPRSDYIWLVRDPLDILHSNRKMWLAMFARYAMWEWSIQKLDDFLCAAMLKAAECLTLATTLLPRDRLIVITFDQLAHDPLATMEFINHRLRMGFWKEIRDPLQGLVRAKAGYQAEKYQPADVSPSITQACHRLQWAQQGALSTHGK